MTHVKNKANRNMLNKCGIIDLDDDWVACNAKNLHLLEKFVKLLDDHLVKKKTLKK